MGSNMNGSYLTKINDCKIELVNIKRWIDKNKLHSNCRFLISYAVIKACGTTEVIFKSIIFDHLTSGANSEAIEYLNRNILESSTNPGFNNIGRLLKSINPSWQQKFFDEFNRKSEKGDLNSLVQLRNQFSHGNSISASIEDVIKYFDGAERILIKLDDIIS